MPEQPWVYNQTMCCRALTPNCCLGTAQCDVLNFMRCPNGQKSNKNSKINRNIKFSELGWPGVEILSGPRGSILHATRASQLPYNAKFKISESLFFDYIPYIFLIDPIKGLPMETFPVEQGA